MQFIDIVCIADDEHSVEVISSSAIKYSVTNKINRKTAVVLAKKIDTYWFIIHGQYLTTETLPLEFAMVADYCVKRYIETNGEENDKLSREIKKITSQELELDKQRQTNSFAGRAWK
ncbi:hypothetical protein EBR43_03825 [bacterium]|nr:hypothetical protein [bacterium]